MEINAYLIKSFQFPFGVFDQLRGNDSELKGQIKYYSPKSAEYLGPPGAPKTTCLFLGPQGAPKKCWGYICSLHTTGVFVLDDRRRRRPTRYKRGELCRGGYKNSGGGGYKRDFCISTPFRTASAFPAYCTGCLLLLCTVRGVESKQQQQQQQHQQSSTATTSSTQ